MSQATTQGVIEEGLRHHRAGRMPQAEAAYRQVLSQDPANAVAMHLLGVLANQVGNSAAAIDLIGRAIALAPTSAQMHSNLGVALQQLGRFDEASRCYEKAIVLQPTFAEPWANLGNIHQVRNDLSHAVDCYKEALSRKSDFHDAHVGLGRTYLRLGRVNDALRCVGEALRLDGDSARAHWLKALILLSQGDYPQGWREFEWRLQLREFRGQYRAAASPRWEGQDLEAKSLLVHAEPGAGDDILLARFLPLLARRGARILLSVNPDLHRLLGPVEGVAMVLGPADPLPPADFQTYLGSLPLFFQTTLQTIPAEVPYLRVDPRIVETWAGAVAQRRPGKQVGLAWQDPSDGDPSRYCPLAELAPLGLVNDVKLCNLQRGYDPQKSVMPWGMVLTNYSAIFTDLDAMVGLLANLDLIITGDPFMAHLAGALGRRTWVILPHAADWPWLRKREDSPWYPTARLFRQEAAGNWTRVVSALVGELKDFSATA